MKVLQINAVFANSSTGRTTREMHEFFQSHGIESYVAAPDLADLTENCYHIGNKVDYKFHALFSRIWGKQGYFSHCATKGLLKYMDVIQPDVVILRNLHGNYVNLPMLLKYLAKHDIATILVLHDCWFYTGNCVYYIAPGCSKWKEQCGHCPVLKTDLHSWFFDQTTTMLKEKKELFGTIKKLAAIGVSQWVANDAKQSILGKAFDIQCIYNWIDLKTFCPKDKTPIRKKYGFSAEDFIVLGVSQAWSLAKGINFFHLLSDILPNDMRLVLVGDSSSVLHKRGNISYLPPTVNVAELAELYAMADVFVNPTLQETFGKTTAEALSSGVPVVAYDGTATPELIGRDEKCGYLIPSLAPELYSQKIAEIRQVGCEVYRDNCRSRSESMFSMEKNMMMYIDLMNRMISNK
ncbi:glycosyltransferase family 4 protein [Bacteroides sp. f07]|uniref:glycosyltransferase n=1 Tax=Bacteroides sp. f07 TaxID=3132704 RepID=UPI0034ADB1E1